MAKPFDLIEAMANFAKKNGIALNAPDFSAKFVADIDVRLKTVLSDDILLHGNRVQNLFEATVISLGHYQLFKAEDSGRVHAAGQLRAPDFRIVLEDGEQWLIEVKNVWCQDPFHQQKKMTPTYLASITSYADLLGVPVKLAFFWSRWKLWTLISPDQFKTANGGLKVTMDDAMVANLMGRIGDVNIGTVAPLRFVLEADPSKPHRLHGDGKVEFTIRKAMLFSDTVELTDPKDQNLAWILMNYGDWEIEGPHPIEIGGDFLGLEIRARPREASNQGFFIGMASRIFSTYFASETIEGKQITQLKGTTVPDWFSPLSRWDHKNSKLPLWILRQEWESSPL